MKRLLILASLCLAIGCSTTTKPPVTPAPPPPPISQSWTNAARLPDGRLTPGIAIYLPAPASLALTKALADAGAVKRSATAWTIAKLDINSPLHLAALTAVGHAGGHTAQHVAP